MLLFDNRNFSMIAAILLGIVNVALFVISFTFTDYLARFACLCCIAVTSFAAIELLIIVQRTDAMTPILREHQDQQLLFSMFEKSPAIADKPVTVDQPSVQYISELPTDNYLFYGATASEMRNRLVGSILARYDGAKIVNFDGSPNAKAVLDATLKERQINKLACEKAVIVLADSLGHPDYLLLKSLGIYWFVASATDIVHMPNKFLDTSTIGYYAPGSTFAQAVLLNGKVYKLEA